MSYCTACLRGYDLTQIKLEKAEGRVRELELVQALFENETEAAEAQLEKLQAQVMVLAQRLIESAKERQQIYPLIETPTQGFEGDDPPDQK